MDFYQILIITVAGLIGLLGIACARVAAAADGEAE